MDLSDLKAYVRTDKMPIDYEFQNNIEDEKVSIYTDGNHKKLAVKKYDLAYLNKNLERCYNEISILKKLEGSQWIIELIDSFITIENDAYLLLSYYPHGDLYKLLDIMKRFEVVQIRNVVNQMLNILTYLRSMKIIHRDIKLENIIATDCNFLFGIKLIDFECATIYDPKFPPIDNVGTHPYKAPEVEKNKFQDFKTDIWSLGVVIYSMKTCEQFNKRIALRCPTLRNDRNLLNLLKGMWAKKPSKRFDIEKCLKHKWISIERLCKNFGKISRK